MRAGLRIAAFAFGAATVLPQAHAANLEGAAIIRGSTGPNEARAADGSSLVLRGSTPAAPAQAGVQNCPSGYIDEPGYGCAPPDYAGERYDDSDWPSLWAPGIPAVGHPHELRRHRSLTALRHQLRRRIARARLFSPIASGFAAPVRFGRAGRH